MANDTEEVGDDIKHAPPTSPANGTEDVEGKFGEIHLFHGKGPAANGELVSDEGEVQAVRKDGDGGQGP